MPLYEYECPVCGRFDALQKMSDKPLTRCPTCAENGKKSKVTRAVSAPSFHLKGSGWYKTDYASSSSSGSKSKNCTKTKEDSSKGSSDTKTSDSTEKKAAAA